MGLRTDWSKTARLPIRKELYLLASIYLWIGAICINIEVA